MYKVDIGVDNSENAAIERRRNAEAARKSRIFDAKSRQIGVDVIALDAQVKERKESENDDKRAHDAFAATMVRNDVRGVLMQNNAEKAAKMREAELIQYRELEQQMEKRREWDLNDPLILKNSLPLGDTEHGVSSLQSFVGEDAAHADRILLQKSQIRDWSLALQAERLQAKRDQNLTQHMDDLQRINLDQSAVDLELEQQKMKKEDLQNLKEYNQKLAEEQRLMKMANFHQEQGENMTEIRNQVLGDTLTENPEVARSAFGSHRVLPDRWKGMSDAEIAGIRQVQEKQRANNLARKEAELKSLEEYDCQEKALAKAGVLFGRDQERRQRESRRQLDLENSELAKQQAAQKQRLDSIYTNVPTEKYYTQFNTSTR